MRENGKKIGSSSGMKVRKILIGDHDKNIIKKFENAHRKKKRKI